MSPRVQRTYRVTRQVIRTETIEVDAYSSEEAWREAAKPAETVGIIAMDVYGGRRWEPLPRSVWSPRESTRDDRRLSEDLAAEIAMEDRHDEAIERALDAECRGELRS